MKILKTRWLVLTGFAIVHVALLWFGWNGIGTPLGDVANAYRPWSDFMLATGHLLGLTQSWVYPFPNLIFVVGPALIPGINYEGNWFVMAIAINFAVMFTLLYWGTTKASGDQKTLRVGAGWVWTFALLLIGPVSISRLDNISIALAIIGVLAWLQVKPTLAAVWFAIATWIKVWPFALVVALVLAVKNRLRVLLYGVGVGVALLVLGLALGTFENVLGFVFEQQDRGIQIESPWAAWWLWLGVAGVPNYGRYYDMGLQTFQVSGGQEVELVIAQLLGPAMYVAVAITFVLGWLATGGTKAAQTLLGDATRAQIFAWTALTAVLDLIVFNKVGSPQYYGWLIVPAVIGVLARVPGWSRVLTWLGLLWGLTGLVYPVFYDQILASSAAAIAVLTLRNLVAIALLVLANVQLTSLAKSGLRRN